ncbi:magnesium transporter MRS2-F-like [Vicia villosa]|uniref:magnesium transporter MRS2-F-like n=1 Tax=Vicia villosa TaxID=3911 RepID=UPI00273BF420|nr:magnesium transporter MRS2-F-like [Vicia villosa]
MGRFNNIVEEEMVKTATMAVRGGRRKAVAIEIMSWMIVSKTGESVVESIDKHSIMRRTGLPARDLRVLDPALSSPSSIVGREKSIVVNLEHIKAIIMSNEVLLINLSSPFFIRFLQDLQKRVPCNIQTSISVADGVEGDPEKKPLLEETSQIGDDSPKNAWEGSFVDGAPVVAAETNRKPLPFEFRALESCIESACTCLESETKRLEKEAYPALDELTSRISTLNLERVRQIKNRLVALSGRVQKVADQLEHLLDDDNDMAEMYLSQKSDAHLMDQTPIKEGCNSPFDEYIYQGDEPVQEKSYESKPNVEELEMLLEAYFAQINGILQKLSSLSEYVDDTEDYINIMLDDKRNQLLQVSVIFNTITMIINAGIVVVGLFGMNIHIDLFDGQPRQFWATTVGTVVSCLLLFLVSIWWGKKKYLLSE